MLLEHPQVASRPCTDCQKWHYDPKTGKRQEDRQGLPILRPAGTKPPCWDCPKKSPEQAHEYELSPANQRLVAYYLKARACGWQVPMDDLTRERFSVIDIMLRAADADAMATQIAGSMMPLVIGRR